MELFQAVKVQSLQITVQIVTQNDVTSKKEQKSNQSDEGKSGDEASEKGQMSNKSDSGDSSHDTNSKKRQIVINISEE